MSYNIETLCCFLVGFFFMEGWVEENVEPADESRFLSPHGGAEKTPEDVVAAQWAEAGGDEICILTK